MSKALSTILFTDPVTKLQRDPAYYGVIPADLIGSDFHFGWTSWQQGKSYSSNLEKVLAKVEGWSEKQKLGDEKVGIDYREWLYQLETLLYDLPGAFDIIKNPQSELRKLLATHELLTGIDLRLRKVVYETFSDNLKRRLYMDKN